jgi:hypothetical protein
VARPKMIDQLAPKFEPVEMKFGKGWYVLATLPRGTPIQLGSFRTEAEAREWIARKSAAWLKDHESGRN